MVDWSNIRARAVQVSDGVSSLLEQMIVDGSIQHEERLPPERELAQRLGVSRTSLREALHELELKGLVDRRPGRGTVVVDPNRELTASLLGRMESPERSLREVMDLRAVIEPPIAARAAQRATPRDVEGLRELLKRMESETSVARAAELDVRFHDAIARATHNPLLIKLVALAAELIDESRRRGVLSKRRRERSIAAHGEIVACIEVRDSDGASAAMAKHISDVNQLLIREQVGSRSASR